MNKIESAACCLGIAIITGCAGSKKDASRSINPAQDGYKLVWADEFNKNGKPDSLSWGYEIGYERNEEFQWYQRDNVWCEDGKLIIEARKETRPNPLYKEGSKEWRNNRKNIDYTSGSINTRKKKTWQYGRFVMRGKIDIRSGLWPAWWTLGTSGRWPATGEIDIMEYYRKKLLANIAYMGSNQKDAWVSVTQHIDTLGGAAWASKFHIWRMDWDETAIAMYVDDSLMSKTPLDSLVNKDGTNINPFKQPHYMLLDLAIGGQQGGDPSSTSFPNRFEVEYVRVYQKQSGE